MSRKSAKIAALIEPCRGQELEAHYLGFFKCFNLGLFYEAHEVLEVLWLGDRQGSNGAFYKGLIQLAGAFVHLKKHRLQPAASLFRLARANFQKYPAIHERLDVKEVLELIENWLKRLEAEDLASNPFEPGLAPKLSLRSL
jgi:predicted metal-dependent hydrolase